MQRTCVVLWFLVGLCFVIFSCNTVAVCFIICHTVVCSNIFSCNTVFVLRFCCTLGVPQAPPVVKCRRINTTASTATAQSRGTIYHHFSETENDQCHGIMAVPPGKIVSVEKSEKIEWKFSSFLNSFKLGGVQNRGLATKKNHFQLPNSADLFGSV